jgi:hypothetical protein
MSPIAFEGKLTRRTVLLLGTGTAIGAAAIGVTGLFSRSAERRRALSKRFAYRLDELPPTDPALLGYKRIETIATGLQKARDLRIGSDGSIFAAIKNRIDVLDSDGRLKESFPLESRPRCLDVSQADSIYVGFRDHVEVYERSGAHRASWPTINGSPFLTSIAVRESDVFVADAGNRDVHRYTAEGRLVMNFSEPRGGTLKPRFVIPSPYFDARMGPGGLLWVANTGKHRIEAYSADGELLKIWGKPSLTIEGFSGCCNPCRFSIHPDGGFVTSEKGLPRVKIYDANGKLQSVVVDADGLGVRTADLTCGVHSPAHAPPIVAADAAGRILLLSNRTGELCRYVPIGDKNQSTA